MASSIQPRRLASALLVVLAPAFAQNIISSSRVRIVGGGTNGALYKTSGNSIGATAQGGAGTLCFVSTDGGVPVWGSCAGSAATAFSAITTSANTSATMTVGAGASLTFTSTGVVNASQANGVGFGSTTATSGNILIGSGTTWVTQAVSGDITINSTGVTAIGAAKVTNAMLAGSIDLATKVTGLLPAANLPNSGVFTGDATTTFPALIIGNSAITLAKMANLANGTIICRTTAGTGVPEACTTLPTAAFPALTGDVTNSVGSLATAIGAGKVTNTMLAGSIAASKLIGTDIATVGTVTAGTWSATAIANVKGGTGGDSSGSTGIAHVAAGTWSYSPVVSADITDGTIVAADIASDAITTIKILDANVTLAKMANIATASFIGRNTAATGVPEVLSATTSTAILNACSATLKGMVPTPPNNTTTFLRGDCTFAAPAGSGTVTVVGAGNLTSTAFVTGGGSQSLQTPSATSTLDSSGNAVFAGTVTATGVSTGTSPPPLTAGTGGADAWAEGTVPTVGPATAVDVCYADATQHGLLCNFNNVGYLPNVQGPASQTTGRVVSWNGTNGGKVADAGFLAAEVVRSVAPGAGVLHVPGSSQVATSSLIVNADITNTTIDLTAKVTGVLPVANGGTGLASGTSGGILAYTASGTLASSGALTANLPVIGGGAGVAPTVGTRSGNTTAFVTTTGTQTNGDCVKIDANGNHVANGSACGSGGSSSAGAPLFTQTADTTVVSSTAETTIIGSGVGSKTTTANYFSAGTSILIEMGGYLQSAAVDTLTVKIKAGSTVVGNTGAVAYGVLAANQAFRLYALVTCRTAGASGTFQVDTIFESTGSALTGQEAKIINTSDITLDTTGTLAWDITAQWSASSASDTITGKTFTMYSPGSAVSSVGGLTGAVSSFSTATLNSVALTGTGVPLIGWKSNITNQSTSQGAVTLATAPTAGDYEIYYSMDTNTPCTTGSNSVSFAFNWTAASARTLSTGSFVFPTAQATNSFMNGIIPIHVTSGNVTYTSTILGTCASGTSSYDINVWLVRVN